MCVCVCVTTCYAHKLQRYILAKSTCRTDQKFKLYNIRILAYPHAKHTLTQSHRHTCMHRANNTWLVSYPALATHLHSHVHATGIDHRQKCQGGGQDVGDCVRLFCCLSDSLSWCCCRCRFESNKQAFSHWWSVQHKVGLFVITCNACVPVYVPRWYCVYVFVQVCVFDRL